MPVAPSGTPPRPRARAPARRPDLDTVFTINPDGSRNFLHPADVRGRFQRRKNVVFALLLLVYIGLPFLTIGGHPAVHLDLPGRAAYLFGATFTNQDFYLMFFLVSGLGFALFVTTALWGRIWCGYACPQTVFLEGIYRRIERAIEGPRDARIRRNLGPWTADKAWRKSLKHVVFLGLAWLNAHVFLAYFIPAQELIHAVTGPPGAHWAAFLWGTAWTAVLYFDFAWFREQTCLVICPYGRAQSAMIDGDTVVIGYDGARGEPRAKLGAAGGGDCIDCHRCVAVCPTGIDIRNGLQMECVGCGNCVDACDEVMARVGRPDGLVRYDSQRGFDGLPRRGLARPRVFVYAGLAALGLAVAGFVAVGRPVFEARVLRTRGLPYELDGGGLRNVFNLHLQNKTPVASVYTLRYQGEGVPPGLEVVVAQPRLDVASLDDVVTPIVATLPRSSWSEPFPFVIVVRDSATERERKIELRFRGP